MTAAREIGDVEILVAAFSATAARLSPIARKRLIARKDRLLDLINQIATEQVAATVETSQGAGLGPILSAKQGTARIAGYATPMKPEDWAGPLAGPTQLEREFGIARSTLHTWQKQNAVIGLLVGIRKHAFPTEQFVDGRPVTGLGDVVEAIGEPRTAWLWLREPNPGLAGHTPLSRLKAGAADQVLEIARANFDNR